MARIQQASDRLLTAKFVSTGEGIAATGMLTSRLRDVMDFMFTSLKGLPYAGFDIVEMQDMVKLNLIQFILFSIILVLFYLHPTFANSGGSFGSLRNVVWVNKRPFTWFLKMYRKSEYALPLVLLKIINFFTALIS